MTIADTSMTNGPDENSIRFCNLCNKPIASESAFKRHVAYCRRTLGKPKRRKRSCKHCHDAKAKCSFEPQCSRCTSKGLVCEYERPRAASASNETYKSPQDMSTSPPSEGSPSYSIDSPSRASTDLFMSKELMSTTEIQTISPPRLHTDLRTDPTQQTSVLFLLEIIRGLPQMMSRRETLPVFIHGHWSDPELPEIFANCQSLSQLFIDRHLSPRGREIFYLALSKETARLTRQLPTASKMERVNSLQGLVFYTLFAVFDQDTTRTNYMPEIQVQKCDVDRVTCAARLCFEADAYAPFDIDKIGDPNETWEEFIYSESRRRCALFWFLASRVLDLQYAATSPPVLGYCGLSLPAPESLWNARNREDFEAARAEIQKRRQQPLYGTTLRTFGDLVDSRSYAINANCGREVTNWLASSDKLGLMLLVASTMV